LSALLRTALVTLTLLSAGSAQAFDHVYADYGAALQAHVRWSPAGHASSVDYAALQREPAALRRALETFAAATPGEFAAWTRAEQMAFLINAYNAWTLNLVLTRFPDLQSIRDLGGLLSSPWKKPFFSLLGQARSLDWIEHEQLRPRYRDARVHFALNCASIGCPALRPEPFVAAQLEQQLDDQQRRFLTDRSRNRYDAARGELMVSSIFKWYGEDFSVHDGGLQAWLAQYAMLLAERADDQARLASGDFELGFLPYDWRLNDSRAGRAPQH
jgi:hypothetical protein